MYIIPAMDLTLFKKCVRAVLVMCSNCIIDRTPQNWQCIAYSVSSIFQQNLVEIFDIYILYSFQVCQVMRLSCCQFFQNKPPKQLVHCSFRDRIYLNSNGFSVTLLTLNRKELHKNRFQQKFRLVGKLSTSDEDREELAVSQIPPWFIHLKCRVQRLECHLYCKHLFERYIYH